MARLPAARSCRERKDVQSGGKLLQRRHHVLDAGVVLESVNRQVFAVPGVLEATVRHLGGHVVVRVDPDTAEVQRSGDPHRAPVVGGPDGRRQAVLGVVRPTDRVVFIAEPLHGYYRPGYLRLNDLITLLERGDDCSLVEIAPVSSALATRYDLRVV